MKTELQKLAHYYQYGGKFPKLKFVSVHHTGEYVLERIQPTRLRKSTRKITRNALAPRGGS